MTITLNNIENSLPFTTLNYFTAATILSVGVLGSIANAIVLIAIWRDNLPKNTLVKFLLSIDLLTCFRGVPVQSLNISKGIWAIGRIGCEILLFFLYYGCAVSLYTLAGMSGAIHVNCSSCRDHKPKCRLLFGLNLLDASLGLFHSVHGWNSRGHSWPAIVECRVHVRLEQSKTG